MHVTSHTPRDHIKVFVARERQRLIRDFSARRAIFSVSSHLCIIQAFYLEHFLRIWYSELVRKPIFLFTKNALERVRTYAVDRGGRSTFSSWPNPPLRGVMTWRFEYLGYFYGTKQSQRANSEIQAHQCHYILNYNDEYLYIKINRLLALTDHRKTCLTDPSFKKCVKGCSWLCRTKRQHGLNLHVESGRCRLTGVDQNALKPLWNP